MYIGNNINALQIRDSPLQFCDRTGKSGCKIYEMMELTVATDNEVPALMLHLVDTCGSDHHVRFCSHCHRRKYLRALPHREAGFVDIQIVDKVNADGMAERQPGMPRIYSARVTAYKPVAS